MNSVTTSANATRGREEGRDVERSHGARPKEPCHGLRLSNTARNIENHDILDDEYVPSDRGFIRAKFWAHHTPDPIEPHTKW